MPGAPIIFRALDVGYSEPSKLYRCVEIGGDWHLVKEMEFKQVPLDVLAGYINENCIAPNKPIFIEAAMPEVKHHLKQKGLHVM